MVGSMDGGSACVKYLITLYELITLCELIEVLCEPMTLYESETLCRDNLIEYVIPYVCLENKWIVWINYEFKVYVVSLKWWLSDFMLAHILFIVFVFDWDDCVCYTVVDDSEECYVDNSKDSSFP